MNQTKIPDFVPLSKTLLLAAGVSGESNRRRVAHIVAWARSSRLFLSKCSEIGPPVTYLAVTKALTDSWRTPA